MTFVLKSVNPTGHIGPDLVELRERVGWSRKDASRQTRLTESFITALEEEQWEEVGDPWYAERMVRAYVRFLGGNEQYFIQKYRQCVGEERLRPRPESERLIRPIRVRVRDLFVGSRALGMVGFFLFLFVLGGYVYKQARQISLPPPLSVATPSEGVRVTEPEVLVSGETGKDASVTVNGHSALVDASGRFSFVLDVPRGTTTIFIQARKRHGEATVVVRHVVYDRPLPPWPE